MHMQSLQTTQWQSRSTNRRELLHRSSPVTFRLRIASERAKAARRASGVNGGGRRYNVAEHEVPDVSRVHTHSSAPAARPLTLVCIVVVQRRTSLSRRRRHRSPHPRRSAQNVSTVSLRSLTFTPDPSVPCYSTSCTPQYVLRPLHCHLTLS